MSRTNPYKKKRRFAKSTLLMFGEGLHEEIFLKHLKNLYARDSGVAVTIRNGKGGTAVDIVTNATREPGDFDRRIVVVDNDKGQHEMERARAEARQRGVELLENSPCLEAILLSILRNGTSFSGRQSDWCKSEFESNYLNKKKRTELGEYDKFFPKATLDTQRTNVLELNSLISLMQGS